MTVSAISQVAEEGFSSTAAGFVRAGIVYVVWASATGVGTQKKIQWKPHTAALYAEVISDIRAPFQSLSVLYIQATDRLLVAWDDDSGIADGHVYVAQLNAVTAALISGPTLVERGFRPTLLFKGGVQGAEIFLSYGLRTKGVPYIKYSSDSGATWGSAQPVLTNQVTDLADVESVPFGTSHVSMIQLGDSGRRVQEIGSLARTRPLVGIAPHPTLADRFFVVESNSGSADLSDHTRGGLSVKRDASGVLTYDGGRLGVDDTIGSLALLDTSGIAPAVVASASYTAGPTGDDVETFTLVPAYVGTSDLAGALGQVASADVSDTHVYAAEYSDVANPTTGGTFVVFKISDTTTATVLSGIKACRAVGVGMPLVGTPVIALATSEGALELLRIYTENALTPTLQATHKLPVRANSVKVVLTSATAGTVYVSMVDRLNIYTLDGLTSPLKLQTSFPLPSGGQFFKIRIAANGNIVCAAGTAGVTVFTPSGRMIAQSSLSTITVPFWTRNTVYPLNSLMQPNTPGNFSAQRYYFKATTGGTSGWFEPSLSLTVPVTDNTVVWTPQSIISSVVTDVEIDHVRQRIYAVGLCGGSGSTNGRVWSLDARGLL